MLAQAIREAMIVTAIIDAALPLAIPLDARIHHQLPRRR